MVVLVKSFLRVLCVLFNYGHFVSLCFCVFGVFSPVCSELSVAVQVIAWKDSSLK